MTDKSNRIGETNVSNEGYKMVIIEYYNNKNIWIEFQDEYKAKVHTVYISFKKGEVKNPYHKSVFNKGYIGLGKYSRSTHPKIYNEWFHMLERCYVENFHKKYPTYKGCMIDDYFLCFQNFAKWYEENYYEIEGQRMHLDKDILVKGNKIYSPQTCVFVPQRINSLFVNQKRHRDKYPIGVKYHSRDRILEVSCSILINDKRKNIYLGRFSLNEPFKAFTCYKNFKENYIKQVANQYKSYIPIKLYEAMYNYKVEIDD